MSLRTPPPLDTPARGRARRRARGAARRRHAGRRGRRRPSCSSTCPTPVPRDEVAAARGGRPRALDRPSTRSPPASSAARSASPATGCGIFPAALPGRDGLFGACWTPDEQDGDGDGCVRPELVWAALDCPTSAPVGELRRGAADGAREPGGPARLPGAGGRAAHDPVVGPRGGGAQAPGRRRALRLGGILTCASRALWIELRQTRSRVCRPWPRTTGPARSAKPPAASRSRPRDGRWCRSAATRTTCSATASSARRRTGSSSSTRTRTGSPRRWSAATASWSRPAGTRRSRRSTAGSRR